MTTPSCIAPALSHFSDQAQNHRISNAVGYHLAQPLTIYAGEIAADIGFEHLPYLLRHDLPLVRQRRA
jgi:hypothetical protein